MMNRGDIFFAELDPTIGSEIKKKRPVLIVSNNGNNKAASTVTVVPLTSNITQIYPFEVLLNEIDSGLSKASKAQCQQIRTISKLRLAEKKAGNINQLLMAKVDAALKLHLALK